MQLAFSIHQVHCVNRSETSSPMQPVFVPVFIWSNKRDTDKVRTN